MNARGPGVPAESDQVLPDDRTGSALVEKDGCLVVIGRPTTLNETLAVRDDLRRDRHT
jgi:hypothetical protein